MSWHSYFIQMAKLCASKSKDRSTKTGAVVVGPDKEIRSTGYNGFPRFVNDKIESRYERPQKYSFTEHAERNCIYNAARIGVSLKDCTLYFNYTPHICSDCARAIIQSGIVMIIGSSELFPGKGEQWGNSVKIAYEMFREVQIQTFTWEVDKLVVFSPK